MYRNKQIKLSAPAHLLNSKPVRVPNKILDGHVPSATPHSKPRMEGAIGAPTTAKDREDGRVLPRELLDDGQGKCNELKTPTESDSDSDMDISADSTTVAGQQGQGTGEQSLLRPPIINATGQIATGPQQNSCGSRTNSPVTTSYAGNLSRDNGNSTTGTPLWTRATGNNDQKRQPTEKWHRRG